MLFFDTIIALAVMVSLVTRNNHSLVFPLLEWPDLELDSYCSYSDNACFH